MKTYRRQLCHRSPWQNTSSSNNGLDQNLLHHRQAQILFTVQVLAHEFALIYLLLTNYHSFQSCTVHLPEIALLLQVECDHTGNLVVDYQHTTPMFEDPVGDRISKY